MHATETETHKAKKQHRCGWCWQFVDAGETYKRYRYYDCGDAGTVKMHPECYDVMQEEAREEGGWFEWTPGQERPAPSNYQSTLYFDRAPRVDQFGGSHRGGVWWGTERRRDALGRWWQRSFRDLVTDDFGQLVDSATGVAP